MIDIDDDSKQYVLNRLDHEHIDSIAKQTRTLLASGKAVEAAYQPGDATWYVLVFSKPVLIGADGGGNDGWPPTSRIGKDRVFVSWPAHGDTSFTNDDDPEWVASKFDTTPASQLAIAELIRRIQAR